MTKPIRIVALLLPLLLTLSWCNMKDSNQDKEIKKVRKSVLAGSWYRGTERGLQEQVDGFFQEARKEKLDTTVRGLISPHAGFFYSGATAAIGYKTLEGRKIKRVIVLALSHRYPFSGGSIADATHYETPLGTIPLDREACDAILKSKRFSTVSEAHKAEHSLEIQLPFLQRLLPDGFRLIPILLSNVKAGWYDEMSETLLPYWDDETVVVASSDFTHYGEGFGYVPFRKDIPARLAELDGGAAELIEALDVKGFDAYVKKTGATICGRKPIALLMTMAKKKGLEARKIAHTTSGEISGDYDTSVSYLSFVFCDSKDGGEMLNESEKETLLRLARDTLRHQLETGKRLSDLSDYEITKKLEDNMGACVTLKINGRLRGCIGYLVGRGPLHETVISNTINAAANDPRFSKVTLDEEPGIHIEISVLSPVKKVIDIEEIVPGRDGLIISRGYHRGTLLPQVAQEYGWTRTEFLEQTCRKAGLPANAYKDPDTKIERYSAQVFGEKE